MQVCSRCKRANPDEAVYCHFDGTELRATAGREETKVARLPHEFVFPSGRRCQSFDELVQACQEEWEVARDLLRQGAFRTFLASSGRLDLAKVATVAQQGRGQTDPDIALETFLNSLPATLKTGPQLDLNPRRLILGTLHVGDTRQVRLNVMNQGKGLLHGTLSITEGNSWLHLADSKGNGECLIKTPHEQQVLLRVDTRGLAAPHKYSAKLTVITNGGIVEVPARLDLVVHPFPRAPFQGVTTPREMAEKMRTQPKAAVPLLESGEVASWFEINGWTYPVQGPAAKGVAAVQQFFEGMGLSKPPTMQLAEDRLYLSCLQGETARGQLSLRTDAKKWVYARADSNMSWLHIAAQSVSGPQQAVLAFEADTQKLQPNRVHESTITITANAGQTFTAQVQVEVLRRPEPRSRKAIRPLVVGAVAALLIRLLIALPGDLYARVLAGDAGSFVSWQRSPLVNPDPDVMRDFVRHFAVATWWLGAVASAWVLWRRGHAWMDLFWGLLAGAAGGLAASATLACLVPILDLVPRSVWAILGSLLGLSQSEGLPWLWTPLWITWAAVIWMLQGALIGALLGGLGANGRQLLNRISGALAGMLNLIGLRRAAAYFALPG
jgi:hypothetical protein